MKHQLKKMLSDTPRAESHLRMKQVDASSAVAVPIDLSDMAWMSSEMETQRVAMSWVLGNVGTDKHLRELAKKALKSRPIDPSPSADECVTRTALSVLAGLEPEDVPSTVSAHSTKPTTYFFEAVALGWIRWISVGDISVFTEIARLRAETGNATGSYSQQTNLIVLHL